MNYSIKGIESTDTKLSQNIFQTGQKFLRYCAALDSHLFGVKEGRDYDAERFEHVLLRSGLSAG